MAGPVSALAAVPPVQEPLFEEPPQIWHHVTCDPACSNAGPFLVYGPRPFERYCCARCGYPMRATELGGP